MIINFSSLEYLPNHILEVVILPKDIMEALILVNHILEAVIFTILCQSKLPLKTHLHDIITCTQLLSYSLIRKSFPWLKYNSKKELYATSCTM